MVTDTLSPINEEEVLELKGKINVLEEDVDNLKSDVTEVKKDVTDIKSNQIRMEEQLKFIKEGQQDLKDVFIQNMNAIHQNLNTNNQLVTNIITNKTQKEIAEHTNETQITITKENNKINLYGKLLLVVAAFFSGSKASEVWTAVKELFK